VTGAELISQGREALRRGDGAAARRAFEDARAESNSGAVLEGLAQAAYLELDFPRSIDTWQEAYAAYRAEGDGVGALRVARMLAYMYGTVVGDAAVMQGWHARSQQLLSATEETAENGWAALSRGMFVSDRKEREGCFREALDFARLFDDRDLEFSTLAYLGASLVHDDRVEEGMLLLDEACAAVVGQEVDDYCVLEEIFCQLFSACEHVHDVARADQWIRIGEAIAARRNLPTVSAFCRTHYGGLLTAAGRWAEADVALTEAVRLWALGHSVMRSGALIRLADLRVRQGRLEEAERLLEGLDTDAEAARPLAALHLARGNRSLAADVIERAFSEIDPRSTAAASLWALLVDVHLARDDVESAATAVEELETCAGRHPGHFIKATAALARGRLCLASGSGDPCACLRDALGGFAKAQMPMELAGARLELARALSEDRPEVAIAEAKAAFDAFERLQAARQADAAAALLRSLGAGGRTGPKARGLLTKREAEVLDLLGHGLSNPEIGDRLYISRKTVEHHVGNVLAKLGLRSRAEAAAYAARAAQKSSS
jgi:DNA-binding CsgD family transcriptional regulator